MKFEIISHEGTAQEVYGFKFKCYPEKDMVIGHISIGKCEVSKLPNNLQHEMEEGKYHIQENVLHFY